MLHPTVVFDSPYNRTPLRAEHGMAFCDDVTQDKLQISNIQYLSATIAILDVRISTPYFLHSSSTCTEIVFRSKSSTDQIAFATMKSYSSEKSWARRC